MSRNPTSNENTSDKKFSWIRKNWLGLTSAIIAILALAIAYQANRIAKDEASSSLKIANEAFSSETMMIFGCQYNNSFYVTYYVVNEYTFANTGGRPVSLINAKLSRGDVDYKVKIYSPQSFDARSLDAPPDLDDNHGLVFSESLATSIIVPTTAEVLVFPQTIDAGTGEKWMFQGDSLDIFESEEEAKLAVSNAPKGKNIFSWQFIFSDGTVLKKEQMIDYSYNPTLLEKFFPVMLSSIYLLR